MEGSAGSPSAALSRQLPAHPDDNMLQTAAWTSKTQEDTRLRPESVNLTGSLVYQNPEETKQRHRETHESAEDPDQLCFIKSLTQTDSVTAKLTAKPLPTNTDKLKGDHHLSEPQNMKESPPPKGPTSLTKQYSPEPYQPKSDSQKPSIPNPDSPKPYETKQEAPNQSTTKPDSQKPSLPKPDSQKPYETKPDSQKTSIPKPDTPAPLIPTPDSLNPSLPKPDSPAPSIPEPDSPAPSISKPDSLNPPLPKPDSPKQHKTKPDSQNLYKAKPDSQNTGKTKQDSPKPSKNKPSSPNPFISKPDTPNPSETKPDLPKPLKTKPDSQKPPKNKPDSPAPSVPTQDSAILPKPKQDSTNLYETKPDSPEPSKTKPYHPKPDTPNTSIPKPDSQEPFISKQDSLNPSDTKPESPKPPPSYQNTTQIPPLSQLNSEQTPPPSHLNTEHTPFPPHLNTEHTPPPPHLNTVQTPPPFHLNTDWIPPPSHPTNEQTPPFPHLTNEQTPPSSHLNTEQTPHPHLNTEQTPHPHLNTEQTPPPSHLTIKQTSPPHLNTDQTPPPSHLNTKQTPPPSRLTTEQTPPPSNLNTDRTLPPSHLTIEQTPSSYLTTEQAPPSSHLNTEQTPHPHLNTDRTLPPSHLTIKQTSPPHLNTDQTPPPSHLNTEQTPPPPRLTTEQTPPPPHLNTDWTVPPLLPLSPVDSTNNLTPAPLALPLIHQPVCDRLQPHPSASSSSGEPKLCGYLQKQAGPLKAWKERWFTYEEKKNQLFYYRTPQDVTPLGKVELCSATFTYPLKAERGTFHIRTPERTFILKAVTEDLMLYWLQQLQVRRWQHRQITAGPELTNNNNNNITDDFLPAMKSPLGLVGEEAANTPSQRMGLANMSLKHPLITIQNSVHSRKRSSQEWTQSVFHVETPSQTHLDTAETNSTGLSAISSHSKPKTPPPVLPLAEPIGQLTPPRGTKSHSMMVSRRDTMSSKRVSRLLQENQTLEEEVKAQKELVWILHKALEASQLEKRACAEFLAATDEQKRLELLRHRERQAVDLRAKLQEAREEAETARRSQAESEAQFSMLQERVRLLEEKNATRQEVIIKLSDQLTTCMGAPSRSSGCDVDSQTFRQLQQKIQNLQDDMEAYQTQNQFLNSEIQQLTRLWRTSSEMEKSLMVKCAHLEAGNCQVESRYLSVLRQLQEVKALDPVQRAAVQKMTEEALKGDLKNVKPNLAREHDEYGFKIIPDYEVEDMKLLAKIQALEIRSHNLLHQERGERPLMSRWAQYLAGRSDDDFVSSPELKGLLRAGIPQEYRQQVWRWLVRARTRTIREHFPQRYQQLCEQSRASSQPAFRQIQLDLHRTLTTNQHFSSPSSPALQQLRRILLAFSWQNPAIGYCQGLNRLAALALLVLQSEEDAFWCLVAVVEAIMPQDYYTKNLVASQADQRVLKDLLSEKLPRLAAHFEDHSIDVSLVSFNWFLVVFVESLPSDILLPLWDAFLYEGTKVIFRYALALFKYKEDDIMKIRDSVEIYQYLRFFTKTISDSRKLIGIAFSDMNPFPSRLLRNRRTLHLERLQAELHELEEQQRLFVTESAEHKDKELDAGVSEDDEDLT